MHVFLDISRLLSVAHRTAPSGIDRVELAYARHWANLSPTECTFVAEVPLLGFSALPASLVRELVTALEEAWESGTRIATGAARRARLALPFGRGALVEALRKPGPKSFLLVSHRALERPARIAALRRQGCQFVPLIHDLIPLHHPEFARAGHAEKHRRRIVTTAALADAIIVNSAATAAELTPWLSARPSPPQVAVAPLGVTPPMVEAPPVALRPYFVVLGTIEPRKNHLLLLNLWRQLAGTHGAAAPRLVVVGRRGWENENVLDMLERCSALDGLVREAGPLPDREVASLLRGARALLFPSFAEGFGLPLAEALALGVPAIASDLAALREVGGAVPDYLDPLDGSAWRGAVLDYARADSTGRRAQLGRLAAWKPPSWERHFIEVDRLMVRLAQRPIGPSAPLPALPAMARPDPGVGRRDEGHP
ncbi:glycosyltransferase family 4 protein [Roseomonas stagni]|uniref:Glycosyltransferase family 4 protein n=1 Tax=Falsiroseomonas algicola TaxID=2716930 RepID=A0A6M1LM43_9PROT|nr:glycosyltransferase family 1 protein [Falsiroseomonas algicola]NGM21420.1 glycosyltransferase family 4 protein [Falsiroseomonas algicola]